MHTALITGGAGKTGRRVAQLVTNLAEGTNRLVLLSGCEIATAGCHLSFSTVVGAQFATGLRSAGIPSGDAHELAALFAQILDGRNAHLTDGGQRALGREPREFTVYAQRTAGTGVWNG